MKALTVTLLNLRELLVALDQALNVIICALTLRVGYSDETMSAHAWRSDRDGKLWGRFFRPIIDALFSWQAKDPAFKDEAGNVVASHCHRAYLKEKSRAYLPPEYR